MRRLTTIAVCAALLAACGGTSDSAITETRATDPPATIGPTEQATTTTIAPTTTVATTVAVTPAPTTEPPTSVVETTIVDTTVPATGLTPLAVETAGEQAALDTAATAAGRAWAMGNPSGTELAAGDPFLVGYEVRLDDGVTQHQILVIDGAVDLFFGIGSTVLDIPGPVADLWMNLAPETPRQQAAVDAALASLAGVAPGATSGGILAYHIAFAPTTPVPTGQLYPHVSVFAIPVDASNPFASGGPQMR
jgi:hypothetical protein